MKKRYYYNIDVLRWVLMLFVCLNTFSFPGLLGSYVKVISNFVSVSFFILSGFLVLRHNKELEVKLKSAMKRTGIMALVLFIFYVLVNAIYLSLKKVSFLKAMTLFFQSKRLIFQFVVFNSWFLPICDNFWFIQCLLYGYFIIFILHKLKLLKYDWIICIACLILSLLTGEFAHLVKFNVLGFAYIPSTVLTRSLPYLLLGRIIGRNRKYLSKINVNFYLIFAPLAAFLVILEIQALGRTNNLIYTGHMIGNGLLGCALCIYVVLKEHWGKKNKDKKNYLINNARHYVKYVYALHQVFGIIYLLVLKSMFPQVYRNLAPFVFLVSFITSLLVGIMVRGTIDALHFTEDKENEAKV